MSKSQNKRIAIQSNQPVKRPYRSIVRDLCKPGSDRVPVYDADVADDMFRMLETRCAEQAKTIERLRGGIESAIEYAANRVPEWGERAEKAFAFLDAALEET